MSLIVSTYRSFAELRKPWNDLLLASSSRSVYQTWEWLDTWWGVFGDGRELEVLAVRDGNDLIGLLPLLRRPVRYAPLVSAVRLELVGTGEDQQDETCSNYLDVIASPGREREVWQAIWSHLADDSTWDEMVLTGVSSRSSLASEADSSGRRFYREPLQTWECGVIDLPGDWDTFLAGMRRKLRAQIRRQRKRLANSGRVDYRPATSAAEAQEAFALLVGFGRKRWRQHDEPSCYFSDRWLAFQRGIIDRFHDRGWLLLSTLRVDDRPVAVSFRYLFKDAVYAYNVAHDTDFDDSLAVGQVERGFNLQHCIERGFRTYDMYRMMSDSYKVRFATSTVTGADLRIRPSKPKTEILRALDAGKDLARRARRELERRRS